MQLIDASPLGFGEFFEGHIPPYAILSPTWEKDEVTFQNFQLRKSKTPSSADYQKIRQACVQALKHNLQ